MITPGHEAAAAEVDWQAQGRTADTAEVRAPAGGAREIYAGHADWGHAPRRTPEGAAEGGSCGETTRRRRPSRADRRRGAGTHHGAAPRAQPRNPFRKRGTLVMASVTAGPGGGPAITAGPGAGPAVTSGPIGASVAGVDIAPTADRGGIEAEPG